MQGYLGKRGDSYDRFLIRLREMYESLNIVFQILSNLAVLSDNAFVNQHRLQTNFFSFLDLVTATQSAKLNYSTKYLSMESLINHFKHYSEGIRVPKGFVYKAIEAPKGEFGVSLISDGTSKPYRCKIRTPSFHHMQTLSRMVQGHYLADLVTVIGTLDIVFGDVDR